MALPEPHAERLLRSLARGGVDFVVVGGIAVVAHGHVRATSTSRRREAIRRIRRSG